VHLVARLSRLRQPHPCAWSSGSGRSRYGAPVRLQQNAYPGYFADYAAKRKDAAGSEETFQMLAGKSPAIFHEFPVLLYGKVARKRL
jgi:hypothetical protein